MNKKTTVISVMVAMYAIISSFDVLVFHYTINEFGQAWVIDMLAKYVEQISSESIVFPVLLMFVGIVAILWQFFSSE